jgi:hypothetical protein
MKLNSRTSKSICSITCCFGFFFAVDFLMCVAASISIFIFNPPSTYSVPFSLSLSHRINEIYMRCGGLKPFSFNFIHSSSSFCAVVINNFCAYHPQQIYPHTFLFSFLLLFIHSFTKQVSLPH